MNNILTLLGLCGPASIIVALIVLALLSQRLGAVTKRPPLYRWLFVSVLLVGISVMARLVGLGASETPGRGSIVVMLDDIALAIGLTLAVIIAWRYWSWLLSESGRDARGR
jgi:hypothetical protein